MSDETLTTREFRIEDYEAACALWQQVEGVEICEGDSLGEVRAYLARNPGLSRVVEMEGKLAGAVMCGHDGRRALIYHLAVAPAFRGRGVGKALVDDCLRELRKTGIPRAIILVAEENSLGRDFWRRTGWEEISARAMTFDLQAPASAS